MSSVTTPPITYPRTFELEVENACGSWTSEPFSVTTQCPVLNIVSAPAPVVRASTGDVVNLSVAAQGASPRVTWYAGAPPDTSRVAANGPTLSVVVTGSASYWYRVVDDCGQTFNSPVIRIVTEGSRRRSVRH
jgi:hypothetical protein